MYHPMVMQASTAETKVPEEGSIIITGWEASASVSHRIYLLRLVCFPPTSRVDCGVLNGSSSLSSTLGLAISHPSPQKILSPEGEIFLNVVRAVKSTAKKDGHPMHYIGRSVPLSHRAQATSQVSFPTHFANIGERCTARIRAESVAFRPMRYNLRIAKLLIHAVACCAFAIQVTRTEVMVN